jgi:hypothetical protein
MCKRCVCKKKKCAKDVYVKRKKCAKDVYVKKKKCAKKCVCIKCAKEK